MQVAGKRLTTPSQLLGPWSRERRKREAATSSPYAPVRSLRTRRALRTGLVPSCADAPDHSAVWRQTLSSSLRFRERHTRGALGAGRSEKRQGALKLKGDPDRGRVHFLARCAICDCDGADGFAAGPDRVTMRNKGAPLLLVAMLDPNCEVAPQYFTTLVAAHDGQVIAGVLTREDAQAVTVVVPGAGETGTLPRSQVKSIERQSRSLMPEGVEAGMTDQEMADLLAYAVR